MIAQGLYKHWKGGTYNVLGEAVQRDTGQRWVVYHKADGDDRGLEVKLVEEFTEVIERVIATAVDGTHTMYNGPRYWLVVSNAEGQK
jgi:hypothetical protein